MNEKQSEQLNELMKYYNNISFEERTNGLVVVTLNKNHEFWIAESGEVKNIPPRTLCDGCVHDFHPKLE